MGKTARGARGRASTRPEHRRRRRWSLASVAALAVFAALLVFIQLAWSPPLWLAGAYLGLSVITFFVYRADKRAAGSRRRRIREPTLLLLGLVGGWPGALVAQQVLRHKTRKRSFQIKFWMSVLVNTVAFAWLVSPDDFTAWGS